MSENFVYTLRYEDIELAPPEKMAPLEKKAKRYINKSVEEDQRGIVLDMLGLA